MICQRQESGGFEIELPLLKAHLGVSGPEGGICGVTNPFLKESARSFVPLECGQVFVLFPSELLSWWL